MINSTVVSQISDIISNIPCQDDDALDLRYAVSSYAVKYNEDLERYSAIIKTSISNSIGDTTIAFVVNGPNFATNEDTINYFSNLDIPSEILKNLKIYPGTRLIEMQKEVANFMFNCSIKLYTEWHNTASLKVKRRDLRNKLMLVSNE